jgi:hypothetical protein
VEIAHGLNRVCLVGLESHELPAPTLLFKSGNSKINKWHLDYGVFVVLTHLSLDPTSTRMRESAARVARVATRVTTCSCSRPSFMQISGTHIGHDLNSISDSLGQSTDVHGIAHSAHYSIRVLMCRMSLWIHVTQKWYEYSVLVRFAWS